MKRQKTAIGQERRRAAKMGESANIHKEDREEILTNREITIHRKVEKAPKGKDKAQNTPREVATPFPP
jgi:hypothetical protein